MNGHVPIIQSGQRVASATTRNPAKCRVSSFLSLKLAEASAGFGGFRRVYFSTKSKIYG